MLQSGGTAALVYGQANTGVATTMLLNQRRAVAAAHVQHGAGDLDLTLVLADGSTNGRVDPAFAAHDAPISMWSEAVWCQWLPRAALCRLAEAVIALVDNTTTPWKKVCGPAAAFVASATRLGWHVKDAYTLVTDRGALLDMRRDSPTFVTSEVRNAVWRWRWRRLEDKHKCLVQGDGGYGPFIQPILRLLRLKPMAEWGAKQQGALRSAVADRQWPQARLHRAGLVASRNCQLCVRFGYCDPDSTDRRHAGTLLHRLWTCPVLEAERRKRVPDWLYVDAKRAIRPDGIMAPADLLLYTQALAVSPATLLRPAPTDESFEWVVPPSDGNGGVTAKFYVDGSMLDADLKLAGCCARRGWAFAAVDELGKVVASAHGRPPEWTGGINGAELWGLLMAAQAALPGASFRVDCQEVQLGAKRGAEWATAPERQLARAWGPLASALEDDAGSVVWMPAH